MAAAHGLPLTRRQQPGTPTGLMPLPRVQLRPSFRAASRQPKSAAIAAAAPSPQELL
jgi:hypothetical protein